MLEKINLFLLRGITIVMIIIEKEASPGLLGNRWTELNSKVSACRRGLIWIDTYFPSDTIFSRENEQVFTPPPWLMSAAFTISAGLMNDGERRSPSHAALNQVGGFNVLNLPALLFQSVASPSPPCVCLPDTFWKALFTSLWSNSRLLPPTGGLRYCRVWWRFNAVFAGRSSSSDCILHQDDLSRYNYFLVVLHWQGIILTNQETASWCTSYLSSSRSWYSRCASSFRCCCLQNRRLTWPPETLVNSGHHRLIGHRRQLVPPSFLQIPLQDAANLHQAAGRRATTIESTSSTYSVLQVIWACKKKNKLLKIQLSKI